MLFLLWYGLSKLGTLEGVRLENVVGSEIKLPKVSVIVPACNEADNLHETVHSILAQEYRPLELIIINDRSTDATGQVLNKILADIPAVKGVHITTLPEGWLGKNYALHTGVELASGEYLLFTDADIRFAPDTLKRAMEHVYRNKLDHLTLLFRNTAPGGLLNAVIVEAMTGLFLLLRPWKAAEKGGKYFIGIGAFNLVARSAYDNIGGHAANPLHPIDDLILGKTLKEHGYSQDCLCGYHHVTVDWYAGTGDMVGGLMKNVFAFYNFHIPTAIGAALIIIGLSILPYLGILFAGGLVQLFCGIIVLLKLLCFFLVCRRLMAPLHSLLWAPLAPGILLLVSLRAMLVTLYERGITWRGTHYSLRQLRTITPLITLKWLLQR
ncbi:glycosyltransferase [Desulfogranum japonicum]|uniref:glycosyltransferase n=1 Tax=Desulfogranum japonicum TaxID=231447 RepID=UPI00068756A7|nr:glycosyltransferase family 2 protein [Desulfogranum japonicum]